MRKGNIRDRMLVVSERLDVLKLLTSDELEFVSNAIDPKVSKRKLSESFGIGDCAMETVSRKLLGLATKIDRKAEMEAVKLELTSLMSSGLSDHLYARQEKILEDIEGEIFSLETKLLARVSVIKPSQTLGDVVFCPKTTELLSCEQLSKMISENQILVAALGRGVLAPLAELLETSCAVIATALLEMKQSKVFSVNPHIQYPDVNLCWLLDDALFEKILSQTAKQEQQT